MLKELPANIDCKYCGAVPADQVVGIFLKYDVFLFPTLGENFGHVVYEALMGGCVPLISDQTPWGQIVEKKCGEIFSLGDINGYISAVQKYVDMEAVQINEKAVNAMRYAKSRYEESVRLSGYYNLIQ